MFVVWVVYIALALCVGMLLEYTIHGRRRDLSTITPADLLPVFPLMLAGTLGSGLASKLPASQQGYVIVMSYMFQSMGLWIGLLKLSTWMTRNLTMPNPSTDSLPGYLMAVRPLLPSSPSSTRPLTLAPFPCMSCRSAHPASPRSRSSTSATLPSARSPRATSSAAPRPAASSSTSPSGSRSCSTWVLSLKIACSAVVRALTTSPLDFAGHVPLAHLHAHDVSHLLDHQEARLCASRFGLASCSCSC